jgi:hypothetical protein
MIARVIKVFFEEISNFLISYPWIVGLIYYGIKQLSRWVVSNLHFINEDAETLHKVGPDLGFMGFTLFAAALTDSSSTYNTMFPEPTLITIIITIILLVLYSSSYFLHRKERQIKNDQNYKIRGNELSIGQLKTLRFVMIFVALGLGVFSYAVAINLWVTPTP